MQSIETVIAAHWNRRQVGHSRLGASTVSSAGELIWARLIDPNVQRAIFKWSTRHARSCGFLGISAPFSASPATSWCCSDLRSSCYRPSRPFARGSTRLSKSLGRALGDATFINHRSGQEPDRWPSRLPRLAAALVCSWPVMTTPATEADHFQIFYKVPDPDARLERLPSQGRLKGLRGWGFATALLP